MSEDTQQLRERAREVDAEFYEEASDRAGNGGGCMELAEVLQELREE